MGNSCLKLVPRPRPPPRASPAIEAAADGPDWLELPEDLLFLILHRLPSIPDLLRSVAVCTAWYSAFREFRRQRRPLLQQALWLIVHETLCDGTAATKLYNLVDQRFDPVPFLCDPSFSKSIVGSSHGWLIMADESSDLYLFNPATGARIRDLPPSASLDCVEAIYDEGGYLQGYQISGEDGGIRRYRPEKLQLAFHKAALSSSPSDGEDYAIVLAENYSKVLAFARPGDRAWTTIMSDAAYKDIVFLKNELYLITSTRLMQVLNLNGNEWSLGFQLAPEGEIDHGTYHLAPCPSSGDLFQIRRFKSDLSSNTFVVYRIIGSQAEIVELESLKDYTFFVSQNNSICLSHAAHPKLRPCCIYFHEACYGGTLGIYNLEGGSIEYVSLAGYVLKWLYPTWIIPSL